MVVVVDVVVVEVEVVFGPISVSGFVDRVAVMGTDLGDNLKLTIPRFHFYYRKRLLETDQPYLGGCCSCCSTNPTCIRAKFFCIRYHAAH